MLTAHSKISNPKSVVRCLLTVVLKSFNITFLISLTFTLKIKKAPSWELECFSSFEKIEMYNQNRI